jgi:putative ABC transport system ATP-binding protein
VSSETLAAVCDRVTKVYQTGSSRVPALREVTAEFPSGAMTAVVGPSGSGKSSLLRLLAAMDAPSAGRLWIGRVAVHGASARTLRSLRRRAGYVFQRASENYVPYLTLGEHLRMARRDAVREPAIPLDEVLDVLGIAHRLAHRVDELSGGEQARGAIAQALAGGCDLIAADEPTAELDSETADAVLGAMRRLVELGLTFVIASHDRAVTDRADAVLRLEHGAVRPAGSGMRATPPAAGASPVERHEDGGGGERTGSRRPVVSAEDLTKSYIRGDEVVHALVDVGLRVGPGESVTLLGRSGSGKTTLLNVAAGWESPDGGRVRTVGRDPRADPPGWADVSVVPQRLGLLRELSIRENVEHPIRLSAGRVGSDDHARVNELLDELGIRELAGRRPAACSLGEQQRAAVARALVLAPRLLIADEPTGHLDAGSAHRVFQAVRRRVVDGMAFLIATHDPEVVSRVDRVVPMRDGRVEGTSTGG